MKKLINKTKEAQDVILKIVEILLAVTIFIAVVYFSYNGIQGFLIKDWSSVYVMYEFVSFILLILLGIEVARLILVHSITVVMELMLLIIARRMLYPEIVPLDLLFCALAFAIIVMIYYFYEIKPLKNLEDLTK